MKPILDTIVERKRDEVARMPKRAVSAPDVREALRRRGDRRDFIEALRRPRAGRPALIAEIKKASPSAGVICADFDPVRIAREYERAGASCLSVLTDEPFFQGSLADLRAIRETVGLPLLRKDFVIDPRQILEAAEWGADAVLLIVAILADTQLNELLALANEAGLAALVEVHDEQELERARAAGAGLIGVNNRDLKTFKVDLATTGRLAERLRSGGGGPAGGAGGAEDPLLVAESGIHSRKDVERLMQSGAAAVLVGETLMRQADIPSKVRELIGLSP